MGKSKKYFITTKRKFDQLKIGYIISTININVIDNHKTNYDKYCISGNLYYLINKDNNNIKLQNIFDSTDILIINFEQLKNLNGHICYSLLSEANYINQFIVANENIKVDYKEITKNIEEFESQGYDTTYIKNLYKVCIKND